MRAPPVLAGMVGTTVLYSAAGVAGLAVPFTVNNVSPVWPASGVAVACLLLFGRRRWPAVMLAAFLVNFLSPLPWAVALGLAIGNTLAAVTGASLLVLIPEFRPSLTRLKDTLGLILFPAVLGSTVSAFGGICTLFFAGIKPPVSVLSEWLMYYLGDAMGVLLVAPLLLSLPRLAELHPGRRTLELVTLLLLAIGVSLIIFDERLYFASNHSVLGLLVFPFVLWAAIRFGIAGTALTNVAIATIALFATAHGSGPFSKDTSFVSALLMQLFFATLTISGLLLSAVVAERQQTELERATLIRQQAIQEAIRESERRYRQIVEVANEGIWTLDAKGITTFANRQLGLMLGYEPQEIVGRNVLEFCVSSPDGLLSSGGRRELCLRRKDGRELWATLSATAIPAEQQELSGMLVMVADITGRKLAEEQLRESKAQLQEVLDNTPALIYMKDRAGRYIFVNREWTDRFRTTSDFVRNKTDVELFPHEAAEEFLANDRIVMSSGETREFEEHALLQDGLYSYRSVKVALRDNKGEVYALCGISTDITEQKAKEEYLRQVHRALRVLSQCNSAVVQATEEQALLNEVCRIAVGPAGYQLAWVGYAESDEAHTVRPVASAGPAEGFLDRIFVSWADNDHGRGAIGSCIRHGKPTVVHQIHTQPAFAVWKEVLDRREFESILAVPLRVSGSILGVLAIYAREKDAFDSSEVELIVELGENLAHGIESLRARKERTEAVAALLASQQELEKRVRLRTAELEVARDAAESADRLKSAFLATMSHELRTPLNSIIGFTGIVLQGLAGSLNSEQTKQLGMVQNSARHLLALINDVLDISKIEAGQLEIHCQPFDITQVIEKVTASILPLATKKGITVQTEISSEVRMVSSDQRRTEQILLNLLSNAVKFTDTGYVTVRCLREESWIITAVRDTGIGIDQKHFKNIFEPFRQVDTGLARSKEGTGLGLSICKRLVERLGGSISVQSAIGKGSEFTIRLPLERKESDEEHGVGYRG